MRRLLFILPVLLGSLHLLAQDISLDWSSSDRSLACPSEISHQTSLPVSISHLNDILYSYTVETSTQTTNADDFSQLPKLIEASQAGCPTTLHDVGAAYTAVALKMQTNPSINPKQPDGSYASVKLADTLKAWANIISMHEYASLKEGVTDLNACSYTDSNELKTRQLILDGYAGLQDFQAKVDAPHTWKGKASMTVGATNTVTVTVTESYAGQLVKSPITAKCDIQSSVLSLSAGPMFSTIPARDYVSVSVPNAASSQPATVNELAVQDKSNLQPLLVGLLNYDLPVPYTSTNGVGIQLSSGPTFRIGGTNNVSSFGYFAGLSVHAWKRLFITPGVHIGEFADYPVGFSQNSVIPSGFGTLTPVKRWTARFGLSLTYRTKSISTLGQKTSTPTPNSNQTQNQVPASTLKQPNPPVPATPNNSGSTPVNPSAPVAPAPSGNPGAPGTGNPTSQVPPPPSNY